MSYEQQYPTPPPTSSPKHNTSTYHPFSPKLPAQETYYQETQPGPKLPAQETYYKQSYSTPASPTHWDPSSHPPADHPVATTTTNYDYLPPRRKSSPIQPTTKPTNTNPYYNPSFPSKTSPLISPTGHRPSSRTKVRTPPPRPIYFSPTNPIPTPYNASRPSPRPGFLSRISAFLRRIVKWAQKNPIKAGLASFLPVLAGAGLIRAGKALGLGPAFAGVAKLLSGLMEGMGGGKAPGSGDESGRVAKGVEKEVKKEWGWGMDHFVGFGGTKKGPLDGIMKVALMGVNHYCKLTPSAVPRAASILLELYFLEAKK
ncbi:uncharacterized protein LY89DRAFT_684374 [Mollisia scopiformis]|uniref:Uncharacterized protein n=1 Tax=Mollisia scopiformis TaxID=149040 RepID=A0A194XAU1_MOLSC|nr:uncharacterized protein LY89DRAFT_684374 [Mollisia scopiformis]KUJ17291.1 hypothetical protein LY89DRAFT_684374 [Mollisia scopiformis]